MRGLQLSRHAWRPRLSSAAVALRTPSSCIRNTSGAADDVTASCTNRAASAVYSTQRLYSTTQDGQNTSSDANSHSSATAGASVSADATTDDAMDLVWSYMPDVHGPNHEAMLTSSPHVDSRASDASNTAAFSPPPPVSYVWVSMHNMPRNWLHEDIVEMIHQVAEHADIAAPEAPRSSESAAGREGDAAGEEDEEGHTGEGTSSALNHVSSPFVRRLHIPFGRRTGLVYGSPKLLLTSRQLADYLIHELSFDPDDFRSRVYFTHTKPEELPRGYQQQQQQPHEGGSAGGDAANGDGVAHVTYTPIEETVEREQDDALRTLVLDRYLFAPDLLLDIAKSHQRRLVTKNEKVLLDAFVDGEEDSDDEAEDEDGGNVEDDDAVSGVSGADSDAERVAASLTRHQRRRQRHRATSKGGPGKRQKSSLTRRVRAGTQKHLGRGSMHNMPIPKPYVAGRNL